MTAMNLIVQERAKAAFLLTDTAYFDIGTGEVVAFGPKVIGINVGEVAHAAVATSGRLFSHHIRPHIEKIQSVTIQGFLDALPQAFRDGVRDSSAEGGEGSAAAAIAVFDRNTMRAAGYVIANDTLLFRATPFKLHRERKHLTEFDSERHQSLAQADVCSSSWDPARDGIALMEAQRADPHQFSATVAAPVIGGQAILTRVDASGISHERIKTWPDRVGARVDLSRGDRLAWHDKCRGWRSEKLRPAPLVNLP